MEKSPHYECLHWWRNLGHQEVTYPSTGRTCKDTKTPPILGIEPGIFLYYGKPISHHVVPGIKLGRSKETICLLQWQSLQAFLVYLFPSSNCLTNIKWMVYCVRSAVWYCAGQKNLRPTFSGINLKEEKSTKYNIFTWWSNLQLTQKFTTLKIVCMKFSVILACKRKLQQNTLLERTKFNPSFVVFIKLPRRGQHIINIYWKEKKKESAWKSWHMDKFRQDVTRYVQGLSRPKPRQRASPLQLSQRLPNFLLQSLMSTLHPRRPAALTLRTEIMDWYHQQKIALVCETQTELRLSLH